MTDGGVEWLRTEGVTSTIARGETKQTVEFPIRMYKSRIGLATDTIARKKCETMNDKIIVDFNISMIA